VRIFTCLERLEATGGGTMFMTGSQRLAQDLVFREGVDKMRSAAVRKALRRDFPWIKDLCIHEEKADRDHMRKFMESDTLLDGTPARVVEMTGEPGDAILTHQLIMHAISTNCAKGPRIVLASAISRIGAEVNF
jgi:hypothetical protein